MPALRGIPEKKWVSWPAKGRCFGFDAMGESFGDWEDPEKNDAAPLARQEEEKNVEAEPAKPANPLPPIKQRKATAAEARASRAVLSSVRCLELAARQTLCMPERVEAPPQKDGLKTYATAATEKQARGMFVDEAHSLTPLWENAAGLPLAKRKEIEAKGIEAAELLYKIVLLCAYCFEGEERSELQGEFHPPKRLPSTYDSAEAYVNADLWMQLASLCGGGVEPAEKLQQLAGHFAALGKLKGPGFGLAGELRAQLSVAALYSQQQGLAWENRLDILDRISHLSRQMLVALLRRGGVAMPLQIRLLAECESFFAVLPHEDPSQRLLRCDPSNAAVLYYLRTSESFSFGSKVESSALVLPDEAPPNSQVPWYRVDSVWINRAMTAALVGSVFPPLREAVERGKSEPELQEACSSMALFGFCQRDRCPNRHVGRITKANSLAYLRLLARQCLLAVQLASLAERFKALFSLTLFNHIRTLRRHWLESLARQLSHSSPMLSSPSAIAEFVDMCSPDIKEGMEALAGSVWLGYEFEKMPVNAGLVLKAAGALHCMHVDVVPVLRRKFTNFKRHFNGPDLPPFMDYDVSFGRPMPVHWHLIHALDCAKEGHVDGFCTYLLTYLDLLIVRKSQGTLFESPHELTWLLEGLAGVLIGRLRRFHHTIVPSSVIHGLLSRYPQLCIPSRERSRRNEPYKIEEKLLAVASCAMQLARLVNTTKRFARAGNDTVMLSQLRLKELLVWIGVQMGIGKPRTSDILTMVERLEIPGLKLPEPAVQKFLDARDWKALFSALCEMRAGSLDPLVVITRRDVIADTPWYVESVKREVTLQEDGQIDMREKKLNPLAPAFVPTSVLLAKESAAKAEEENAGNETGAEGTEDEEAMQAARDKAAALLESEETAAKSIQAWWRARVSRRGAGSDVRDTAFDVTFEEAKGCVAQWKEGREGEKAALARKYGMLYLGHVADAVCQLKKALQKVRERSKALRKGESADDDELDEYFERLDTLKNVEDSVLACLKSTGPSAEHHFQLDIPWLENKLKRALEALGEATKALSVASYTKQEKRARKRRPGRV